MQNIKKNKSSLDIVDFMEKYLKGSETQAKTPDDDSDSTDAAEKEEKNKKETKMLGPKICRQSKDIKGILKNA